MPQIRYLNVVLTLIAVLLSANLVTLWSLHGPETTQVQAQAFPQTDQKMLEELKKMNDKLASVESTLTSGKMRVIVDSMPTEQKD